MTRKEYSAAVDATVACIEEGYKERIGASSDGSPLVIHDPVLSADAFMYTYSYTIEHSHADAAKGGDVTALDASCRVEHLDDVQLMYQVGLRSDAEYVSSVSSGFVSCASELGLNSDKRWEPAEARELSLSIIDNPETVEQAFECLQRFPSITEEPTAGLPR